MTNKALTDELCLNCKNYFYGRCLISVDSHTKFLTELLGTNRHGKTYREQLILQNAKKVKPDATCDKWSANND